MSREEEYVKKILAYPYSGLLDLWEGIKSVNTPGWDQGKALEYLILRAFQLEGARISWPYSVRMGSDEVEQIDGVVYAEGLACLIECKDKDTNVNIEPIAKLRNQLLRRHGAAVGVVFSREGFTAPALTLAQFTAPQSILLWGGDEIGLALTHRYMRRGLIAKYRYCIEQGLPDYHISLEGLE